MGMEFSKRMSTAELSTSSKLHVILAAGGGNCTGHAGTQTVLAAPAAVFFLLPMRTECVHLKLVLGEG